MDDYEVLSKIGDGSFGTVYLCRRRNVTAASASSQVVAVKKMKRKYSDWNECMHLREVSALKRLNHKNIVSLMEMIRDEDTLYLVFEHMDMNLYELMRKQTRPLPESAIKLIIAQLIDGLSYIHRNGFFHRDIKPENLLCDAETYEIKIADFGLVREVDSEPPYTEYIATRWYRSPELLLHAKRYDWSVDIWAAGCIASELYLMRPLFPGRSEIDQLNKISQLLGAPERLDAQSALRHDPVFMNLNNYNLSSIVTLEWSQVFESCSSLGIGFLRKMLCWYPAQRSCAKDLSRHKFLADTSRVSA